MTRRVKKMNKKGEKAPSNAAVSVATANVVATRNLATTTTISAAAKRNIPNCNPKSHPKTLDIPCTPPAKRTAVPATNGVLGSKGDKRAAAAVATASHKMVSSQVSGHVRGTLDNGSKERQQQNPQQPEKQPQPQKTSPSSAANHPSQFASICREVAQIREEHVAIRKSLSEREGELGKTRVALRSIAQERDLLRNKVCELENMLKRSPEMYSHVAAILSQSGSPADNSSGSGSSKTSPRTPIVDFHNSPLPHSSVNGGGSSSQTKLIPNNNACTLSMERANSITVSISSPLHRNILQQTQRLTTTTTSSASSRLDMVPLPISSSSPSCTQQPAATNILAGTESPRKYGTHNNAGTMKKSGGPGMEEMQRVPRNSPLASPPNINSHESHHTNNNNKNLQQQQQPQPQLQKQHSSGSSSGKNHRMSQSDKSKSIYSVGEHPLQAPPSSMQYLEYHHGNGHNENGNDLTNSNNNNNHLKKSTCSTEGGGGGRHHQHHHLSQSGMTGLDLMLLGPDCSTKVVEHLVHPLAIESSVREIQHTLVLKGVPLNGERLREVEIEIDRLNSRIDHLRSQNDVLTLNLEDAKSHADRLTVLLGKYESNNVALQLTLRYSDQMTDAYEVLVALLETELGQMVTRLHAGGHLHLICPTPQPIPSSGISTPKATTAAEVVVSRSGNNNNSNDTSPSENVSLLPTSTTPNNINGNNSPVDEGKRGDGGDDKVDVKTEQSGENNNGVDYDDAVGRAPNNNLTKQQQDHLMNNVTKSGTDCGTMVIPVKSHTNKYIISPHQQQHVQQDRVISPTLSSINLVEQAKRNRLAAERAARFLLSQFSRPTTTSSILPTGNRGSSLYQGCQSNSTASIVSSVTSNLSNISGESGGSLSPSSLDGEEGHDLNDQERHRPSTIITVGKEETQVGIINAPEMRSSTGMSSSNNNSPTTSSTTFRAAFTPNGNSPAPNGGSACTSFITSLLPLLLGNNNEHGSSTSPTGVSEAIEPGIRHLISTLKGERDAVKQTVMELESESLESLTPSPKPTSPYYNSRNKSSSATPTITAASPWSPADARKLDLETAVLMQELMAMKEERAELRAQLFLLEKEKDSLQLHLQSHESQEEAYRARINYLKSEIMDCKTLHSNSASDTLQQHDNRNRNDVINSQQKQHQQQQQQQQNYNGNNRNLETIINNNNNNNQNVNWEREALLKKRIHELASTLERVTDSSQDREKLNQEMINELNRANGILMQTLDCAKKKYQNRIKKMEDQIVYISERHATQLRLFGERMPIMTMSRAPAKYHS